MIDTFILVAARVLALISVVGFCFLAMAWGLERGIKLFRFSRVLVEYVVYRRVFIEWKKRYGDDSE
jgi:hypothetical protein